MLALKTVYTPLEILTMPERDKQELRGSVLEKMAKHKKAVRKYKLFLKILDEILEDDEDNSPTEMREKVPKIDRSKPSKSTKYVMHGQLDCIIAVLTEAGGPMHLRDIAKTMIYNGYGKGEYKNWKEIYNSISSVISSNKKTEDRKEGVFERVGPGIWKLVKVESTTPIVV